MLRVPGITEQKRRSVRDGRLDVNDFAKVFLAAERQVILAKSQQYDIDLRRSEIV